MAYEAPPVAYAPAPMYAPAAPRPTVMHGKQRPYILVLLLYVVTFTIYGYYWYFAAHNELCRQTGRENREKPLFLTYLFASIAVVILFVIAFAVPILGLVADALESGAEPSGDDIDAALAKTEGLVLTANLLGLAVVGVMLFYAHRMWSLIAEVKRPLGISMRAGFPAFAGMVAAAEILNVVSDYLSAPLWLASVVLSIVAYYLFVTNYNDIWRHLAAGRPLHGGPQASAGWTTAAPPAQTPGGSWDAPIHAVPVGTSYRPPGQPAASGSGFSVHDRAPQPAPAAMGRVLEQRFQCPRCHAHVAARGLAGSVVTVRCSACGEAGNVTLPGA